MLLSEAERLGLLKKKTPYKPEKKEQLNKLRKEQAEYLHPKILESEAKSPFKVKIFQNLRGYQYYQGETEVDKAKRAQFGENID